MDVKPRKVMVGSPSYDGTIDVWYVNSLMNTIKYCYEHKLNIDVIPIWVSFDALVQRCRNDTIWTMIHDDFDDLVWIDVDIEWQPKDFFKLLDYPVDVVGGTYPKKTDRSEIYVGDFYPMKPGPEGLYEVGGLGTGFLRFSRKACQWLWDNSEPYIENPEQPGEQTKERRWIFDVRVGPRKQLVSEDIYVCRRLTREGGFKIYLDPNITCNHSGGKKYKGNFLNWYKANTNKFIHNQPVNKSNSGIDYLKQFKNIY